METQGSAPRRPRVLRVFAGVLVIGVGLVTLGERLDLFEPGYSGSGWPLVAVAVGFARLAAPCVDHQGRTDSRRLAGWLLAIGTWGLLNEYRVMGLAYTTSWPLLVVYAGVDMVWRAAAGRDARCSAPPERTR